ncbi:fimbrillin family protein [Parabacteroides bouchesdurhonensis]|uniref:fimbrillin family protein n=1 Tax=Parabacteroides bouchesdurhonensis TaxID=1936995 RepID=UPI000E4DBBAA|nr:fimbrillin family protein [Parabacteroides bouchesdurhonensis]RHJ90785.1 fimbrillin family protein [Bacteroides sp. AM07-16]
MKNLIISMLAMAAMVSCTSENDPINEVTNNDKPTPVVFGQSISLVTKAPITGNLLANTKIGIWAQEYTTTPAWVADNKNFMDDLELTVAANGDISYTGTKYYSIIPDTKYDFYAYAPKGEIGVSSNAATAGVGPTINLTLGATDQIDLMYASQTGVLKSATPVALVFKHSLAQIKFKIKKTTSSLNYTLSEIKVNANSVGTMALANGQYSNTGTPIDFTVLTGGSFDIPNNDFAEITGVKPLMLFPEELKENSVIFTISGTDYKFKPTATLQAGTTTTISVTVTSTGVEFSQSVEQWKENTGEGTIG